MLLVGSWCLARQRIPLRSLSLSLSRPLARSTVRSPVDRAKRCATGAKRTLNTLASSLAGCFLHEHNRGGAKRTLELFKGWSLRQVSYYTLLSGCLLLMATALLSIATKHIDISTASSCTHRFERANGAADGRRGETRC